MLKKTSSNAQAHTPKSEATAAARRRTGFPVGAPRDSEPSLQQVVGNQAVQRLYKSGKLQAALKIGRPNDAYEQEADRMADHIMRMTDPAVQMKPG